MVNEVINYRTQKMRTKQGNQVVIVYIDPYTSENLYNHKAILTQYGAKWDGSNHRWFWYLSNDPEKRETQMEKMIKPCIRELNAVEDNGKPGKSADEEIEALQGLIAKVDELINAKIETTENFDAKDAEAVKRKLLEFKKQLMDATTDEEFRQRFEPMLKMIIEGGREYSFLNTLLIKLQDPEATFVYSLSNWNKRNRYVDTAHAKPICMWKPIQDNRAVQQAKAKYLQDHGLKHEYELTPEQEKEMWEIIKHTVPSKGKMLVPSFYDIRFTKVKRGKKDLVKGINKGEKLVNTKSGNENGDLKWFDENTPVTEESVKIYNALIQVIQNMGLKLDFTDNIDGTARGVSMGGAIKVLKSAPKNIGTCNTLIHELSHEMFHWMNLQGMDDKWKRYYLGTSQGRGVVEQQAELCAWIVMRFLGYDMKTNINYIGNWGINEENAAKVFDQVANAADKITGMLFDELGKEQPAEEGVLNESIVNESLTGLGVASLLGDEFRELYIRSKKREEQLEESRNKITDEFNRVCGKK